MLRILLPIILFISLLFLPLFLISDTKLYKAENTSMYLTGEFEDDNVGIDKIIKALRNAKADDTISIYLQTPGGSVLTALQLLNAIEDTKAKVITIADGAAISAGFLTLVSGDEIRVSKHGVILAHIARFFPSFNEICIPPLTDDMQALLTTTLLSKSVGIFTKEEVRDMLWGKDIKFTNEEFSQRINGTSNLDIATPNQIVEIYNKVLEEHSKLTEECIEYTMKPIIEVQPIVH